MANPITPLIKRGMTAAQLREHLEQPPEPGKAERQLRAIVGIMSEEEASGLEQRIHAMNEGVDELCDGNV